MRPSFQIRSAKTNILALLFALLFSPLLRAQLNLNITTTNVSCWGAADGQAKANPSGGTPPYAYAWSNSQSTQTITNLGPGTYSVTVSDANQNTKTASKVVTQPARVAPLLTSTPQTCIIGPDGQANCVAYAGIPPYTYLWSNNQTTDQITGLTAGVYSITVTDAKHCSSTKSVTVADATADGLRTHISVTPTICNYDVGVAQISMMSGTPPYQFLWSTGGTGNNIKGLSAGIYTISVIDVNGCSTTDTALVADQGLPITNESTDALCGYNNGSATVLAEGGTPPYQYLWNTGATIAHLDSLSGGAYTATVTDNTGCSGTEMVYVWSDSYPIVLQLIGPKCINNIATFTTNALPFYPDLFWKLNDPLDQIISGQGTDSIEVKWNSPGHKLVSVSYGVNGINCAVFKISLEVYVCAASTEPALSAALVSPNPFSDFLQIDFPEALPEAAIMTLTDISSKPLMTAPLPDLTNMIPVKDLPAGMYFLRVYSGDGERVWKMVKQ